MTSSVQYTIGHRLKLEMQRLGITSAELAKRADVKTSFIYDIMNGKSANPSTVKLARVAESLGVSLGYLVGSDTPASPSQLSNDGYVVIPQLAMDNLGEGVVKGSEEESCAFRVSWLRERFHTGPEKLRLLRLRDDSMESVLCHNDTLLIDTSSRTPSPPGIFVLFDGAGLLVRRVEYVAYGEPPRIRILPDNPLYSTYERSLEETLIIGRVVWFAREI
ncbi:MAG: LexA family transcriptional regulator [Pseudomonadota bacterium]|nr:LexA family transcriptional regulator [Pseudomonadota bacterium]